MEALAELVEAPVDWLGQIPDPRTEVIARLIVDLPDPIDLLTRLVGNTADMTIVAGRVGDLPPSPDPGRQRKLRDDALDELHDFFCSKTRYIEERHSILSEYSAGESFVVANITAAISAHVDGNAAFLVPAVAVTLTVICKMGLNVWCVRQQRRRAGSHGDS